MSIASFFKSLFGGSTQQTPVTVQAVKARAKSSKVIAKKRTKAKRDSHPWLAKETKRIVFGYQKFNTTHPDKPYHNVIEAPMYMELSRARRLVANNLIGIYGTGRVRTKTFREDHTIQITIK